MNVSFYKRRGQKSESTIKNYKMEKSYKIHMSVFRLKKKKEENKLEFSKWIRIQKGYQDVIQEFSRKIYLFPPFSTNIRYIR